MTDKTMPERIYAWGANDLPRWSADNLTDDAVEYIRADLAQGDASEPLADGQMRWVKSSQGGKWIVGAITNYGEGNDFFCNSDRFDGDMPIEDYFKIGPVIRPPEDVL